jgi:hypothetical protein
MVNKFSTGGAKDLQTFIVLTLPAEGVSRACTTSSANKATGVEECAASSCCTDAEAVAGLPEVRGVMSAARRGNMSAWITSVVSRVPEVRCSRRKHSAS